MQNFAKAKWYSSILTFKEHFKLLLFIILLLRTVNSFAQVKTQPLINATLSGKVIDAQTKEPLPGALVQLEGVTHSVQTDFEGKFNFVTGQKLPVTIIVSYLGYEKLSIVATSTPITVELKENRRQLNDVVVVGYATQQRRDLIGSVNKIDPGETKTIAEASFDSQLQGKAAGVQI